MQKFWQSVYSRRMPQKTAWLLAFWWACCTLRESKKSKGSFSLGSLAKSSSKVWVWECRAGGKKMDVGQSFWSSIERAKSSKNSKPGTCWCKRTPQSLSFSFRVCLFSDKLYWCASTTSEILFFYFSFYFFFLGCICFKEPSSGCGERLLSHQDASTCYLWKSGFELFKAGQATSMAPFGKLGARLAKCLWILQCGNCSVNLKWNLFLLQQYKQQVGQDCTLAINVGKKKKLIADKVVLFQCKRR